MRATSGARRLAGAGRGTTRGRCIGRRRRSRVSHLKHGNEVSVAELPCALAETCAALLRVLQLLLHPLFFCSQACLLHLQTGDARQQRLRSGGLCRRDASVPWRIAGRGVHGGGGSGGCDGRGRHGSKRRPRGSTGCSGATGGGGSGALIVGGGHAEG